MKNFIVIDFRTLVISRANSLILYGAAYYTSFVNAVSIIATDLPSRHFTSKNKTKQKVKMNRSFAQNS